MLRGADVSRRGPSARAVLAAVRWRPALLVLVPAGAVALLDGLGPGSPWSLAGLVATLALVIWLVAGGRRGKPLPLVRTFLGAAAAFAVLCLLAAPIGPRPVSTLSILAVLYLLAGFVAHVARRERVAPGRARAAAASGANANADVFGAVQAGLVAAAALLLAVPFALALRPAIGLFATDALGLSFAGRTVTFGLETAKLAFLGDAVAGGLLIFACARALGSRSLFGAAAGIAWIAAGSRLGPQFWAVTPTFVVPLYAFALAAMPAGRRPLAAGSIAAATGLFSWPLLVPLAVLTLGYALWCPDRAARATLLRGVALGTVIGVVLAVVPGSLVRPPATIVAAPIDAPLRLVGGDGVWPWTLLLPSVTSALFGGTATALLSALGFAGNALFVTAAPGWTLTAALAAAAVAYRRRAPRAVRAGAGVALAVMFLALPSHAFAVPLPTPAELTYLAGASGWLASSAALALACLAALAGAATLTLWAERGRPLAATAGLVLVLLETAPAGTLFPNLAASAAVGALRASRATVATAALYASLYDDDPRARLARAQAAYDLGASPGEARAFVHALPLTGRLRAADLGFPARAVAVVDLSAYDLYRGAPFAAFVLVPNDLVGTLTVPDQVTNPEIDETLIEGVYGSDYAYVGQ